MKSNRPGTSVPPRLRSGSGATVLSLLLLWSVTVSVHGHANQLRGITVPVYDRPRKASLSDKPTSRPSSSSKVYLHRCLYVATFLSAVTGLVLMHPGQAGGGGGTTGRPPSWNSDSYSSSDTFESWIDDLKLWCLSNQHIPQSRMVPMILQNISGSAKERCKQIIHEDNLINGGYIDGSHKEPLEYLILQLAKMWAPLSHVMCQRALEEFESFSRRSGERVDVLLSRFQNAWWTATVRGQHACSYATLSNKLLNVVGISPTQRTILLQQWRGLYPSDMEGFGELIAQIRLMGGHLETGRSNRRVGRMRSRGQFVAFTDISNSPNHKDVEEKCIWNGDLTFERLSQEDRGDASDEDHFEAYMANLPSAMNHSNRRTGSAPHPVYFGSQPTQRSPSHHSQEVRLPSCSSSANSSSETTSDHGEHIDFTDCADMEQDELTEHLKSLVCFAKKRWRRHRNFKPTRKVRRKVRRRFKSKGAHKIKGRHMKAFIGETPSVQAYFEKKGHKGKYSTGMGVGRKLNPIGKDGKRMTCHNCGSESHFKSNCPKGGSKVMYVGEPSNHNELQLASSISIFMVLTGDQKDDITDAERASAPLLTGTGSSDPWTEKDPWSGYKKPGPKQSTPVSSIHLNQHSIASAFGNVAAQQRQVHGTTRKEHPARSESAPPPAAKRSMSVPSSPASSMIPGSLLGEPFQSPRTALDARGLPLDSQDPDEEARERQLRESLHAEHHISAEDVRACMPIFREPKMEPPAAFMPESVPEASHLTLASRFAMP